MSWQLWMGRKILSSLARKTEWQKNCNNRKGIFFACWNGINGFAWKIRCAMQIPYSVHADRVDNLTPQVNPVPIDVHSRMTENWPMSDVKLGREPTTPKVRQEPFLKIPTERCTTKILPICDFSVEWTSRLGIWHNLVFASCFQPPQHQNNIEEGTYTFFVFGIVFSGVCVGSYWWNQPRQLC